MIYNGQPEWSAPLSLLACIDADEELLALQRDFGYQVRHLRPDERDEQCSEDPVVRSVLRALAWAYARNLNWEDLVRLLRAEAVEEVCDSGCPPRQPPNAATQAEISRSGKTPSTRIAAPLATRTARTAAEPPARSISAPSSRRSK